MLRVIPLSSWGSNVTAAQRLALLITVPHAIFVLSWTTFVGVWYTDVTLDPAHCLNLMVATFLCAVISIFLNSGQRINMKQAKLNAETWVVSVIGTAGFCYGLAAVVNTTTVVKLLRAAQ
ncbi:MAG: hypothetical protein AAF662_02775 [Pseudomonadota bacterium]